MGVRRFTLLLALVVGCAHSGNGEGWVPPPAPECFPWTGLTKPVEEQSAKNLLEQIKQWALAAGGQQALADEADRRKNYRFTYGNPAVVYGDRHGWARVLIAYRYAELASHTDDSTLKAVYFKCAYDELKKPGEQFDNDWAATAVYGPAMTAASYLNEIEQNALGPPPAPPPYSSLITDSVRGLRCRHGPYDLAHSNADLKVDLCDEVLWARVVLAYYLSEYSTPSGVRLWALCSTELDYIED